MADFVSPVANRTLVSVDPKDPARWTGELVASAGLLIDSNYRSGALDEYRTIATVSDIGRAETNDATRLAMERLRTQLGSTVVSDAQLKGAALSLSGHFGDEVSLVGLQPELAAAVRHLQTTPDYAGRRNLRPYEFNARQPVGFIAQDGILGESDRGATDMRLVGANVSEVSDAEAQRKEQALNALIASRRGISSGAPSAPVVSSSSPSSVSSSSSSSSSSRTPPRTPTPAPSKGIMASLKSMFTRSPKPKAQKKPDLSIEKEKAKEADERRRGYAMDMGGGDEHEEIVTRDRSGGRGRDLDMLP